MPTLTRIDTPAKNKAICVVCKQEILETIFMGRPIWNHVISADLETCITLGCIGKAEPTT